MNSNAELNHIDSPVIGGYGLNKVFNLNTKCPYISKDKEDDYFGKY